MSHVIFGTGAVGVAVMEALSGRGERVRMINRTGIAEVPDAVALDVHCFG
jgi:Trk K+ transport system NAD-binding subunit